MMYFFTSEDRIKKGSWAGCWLVYGFCLDEGDARKKAAEGGWQVKGVQVGERWETAAGRFMTNGAAVFEKPNIGPIGDDLAAWENFLQLICTATVFA